MPHMTKHIYMLDFLLYLKVLLISFLFSFSNSTVYKLYLVVKNRVEITQEAIMQMKRIMWSWPRSQMAFIMKEDDIDNRVALQIQWRNTGCFIPE